MIKLLVGILVFVINTVYRDRPYPRFYVLETVARVPYFSYLSVLHLYETLGFWRKADWLKVHFAESWNELHHLLIMESLGGSQFWGDRILARTTALIYYWIIVALYIVSSSSAYNFMELVENHAYDSYQKFLTEHEAELKLQPAPAVAINYYRDGDLYMFDEFQTANSPETRRPKVDNLYDVFVAIRDDEMEHVKTMVVCQQANAQLSFKSPHALPTSDINDSKVLSTH
ncbi:plastoquinol terminal oxidase [Anabaena cylindrica FACHB-243]|uniref:Plastoquinol oxidase immutans n=1 Tax=Anabaena cylindrica (strain ATCC 27899 / PCC 7122) TaxID=272123 RepID=K9ZNJ6_ANACC|nr:MULTISPECIES: alternative oxidase [Anabaena]AFZ59900.1 plastoquinol oxidase immutans [Anabaena cylindrica PCC 7122]MBD2416730.1 plastoquinol terminal oxidase [Anabaena cylindrica FACHB-243]MBY5285030.1 plastoquinol terminal oxidase [Anabaena sp. CCAP 1446/1C]MBY5308042.1 plastoquinol terminal oxidase [Anabaena sp. CCAP 1446/1C]MCM2409849.1 plastoquinol terminal oxidase [Anabaena sp. CCAP 1446/1C]